MLSGLRLISYMSVNRKCGMILKYVRQNIDEVALAYGIMPDSTVGNVDNNGV